jgi:hypothetical protein
MHDRFTTTEDQGRSHRKIADGMITLARRDTSRPSDAAGRVVRSKVRSAGLFKELAQLFATATAVYPDHPLQRPAVRPRAMAIIEWTEFGGSKAPEKEKKAPARKAARRRPHPPGRCPDKKPAEKKTGEGRKRAQIDRAGGDRDGGNTFWRNLFLSPRTGWRASI